MNVLLDSSFLFVINSPNDKLRPKALQAMALPIRRFILADVILTETSYMLRERISLPATLRFLDNIIHSTIELMPITKTQLQRARDIMTQYDFDLADCCLLVLAEELNINHVCTFDDRDFRRFRPKHVPFLTLLPSDLPSKT